MYQGAKGDVELVDSREQPILFFMQLGSIGHINANVFKSFCH